MVRHYKQLLFLDSAKAIVDNNKYKFNVNFFRISKYKLKKYVVNGIDMSTNITYVCCPELAENTINRNSDSGLPTDIIGIVTNDQEIDIDRFTMFLNGERWFKTLTIYFKDSQGNLVTPTNFVVCLDIEKET